VFASRKEGMRAAVLQRRQDARRLAQADVEAASATMATRPVARGSPLKGRRANEGIEWLAEH
jgi:hypothetical protein